MRKETVYIQHAVRVRVVKMQYTPQMDKMEKRALAILGRACVLAYYTPRPVVPYRQRRIYSIVHGAWHDGSGGGDGGVLIISRRRHTVL